MRLLGTADEVTAAIVDFAVSEAVVVTAAIVDFVVSEAVVVTAAIVDFVASGTVVVTAAIVVAVDIVATAAVVSLRHRCRCCDGCCDGCGDDNKRGVKIHD